MVDYTNDSGRDALDKIQKIVRDLDDRLLSDPDFRHRGTGWLDERQALHEIRRELNKAGRYDDFDEGAFDELKRKWEEFKAGWKERFGSEREPGLGDWNDDFIDPATPNRPLSETTGTGDDRPII